MAVPPGREVDLCGRASERGLNRSITRFTTEDRRLLLAEDDSAFRQIVRGKLHLDAIAWEDADEMLSHLAGDDAEDLLSAVGRVQTQLEHGVGQGGGNSRLKFNRLAFGQGLSPAVGSNKGQIYKGIITARNRSYKTERPPMAIGGLYLC